jgi:hypothetical protein
MLQLREKYNGFSADSCQATDINSWELPEAWVLAAGLLKTAVTADV